MIFIDEFTRHTRACTIEKKSEVLSCFLKVKTLAERETMSQDSWWKRVLLQPVLELSTKGRNSTRILLQIQTTTEWSDGAEESDYQRSSHMNAKILLRESHKDSCLPTESDFYKWRSVAT